MPHDPPNVPPDELAAMVRHSQQRPEQPVLDVLARLVAEMMDEPVLDDETEAGAAGADFSTTST